MKLPIPRTWKEKISKLTESELVLLAVLHHIQKQVPEYDMVFYKYDLMLIINFERGSNIHNAFINLTQMVRAGLVSDRNVSIHLKHWTEEEILIDIDHTRNIALWWHVFNQGGYRQDLYEEREPCPKSFRDLSKPENRQFVKWLKKSYPLHDPRGEGRIRYLA